MINIRPVSDLRNKFSEIEEEVTTTNSPIFFNKKWIWSNGGNEY